MIKRVVNHCSNRGRKIGAVTGMIGVCCMLDAPLGAEDFGSSFSVSQGVAAQSMIQSVGDTTNQMVVLVSTIEHALASTSHQR